MPELMTALGGQGGIAGIVLAGGRSSRMGGREKALLPIGDTVMAGHVAARLAPQVAALAINANGDPDRLAFLGLPAVADTVAGFVGPLAGIAAGMGWAAGLPGRPTHLVSVAADTPFFPQDLVARLAAALDGDTGRIALAASAGRVHPVFGLWPLALEADLLAFLRAGETYRVSAFAGERHAVVPVEFELERDRDPFFNVNTPAEFELAKSMFSGGPE